MKPIRTLAASSAALLLTAAALAGCGGDSKSSGGLDRDALEADIAQRLVQANGGSAPQVACPSDLAAKVGATIRCRVGVASTSYGITVTVTGTQGGSAQYELRVDEQ